jgi:hypothetical protein
MIGVSLAVLLQLCGGAYLAGAIIMILAIIALSRR